MGSEIAKHGRVSGRPNVDGQEIVIRGVVVGCSFVTCFIHASLGGLLFAMNAVGYGLFAVALVLPLGPARRLRWLARLGLLGFTVTTILGWVVMGARFPLAYLDKGIELVLVGFLVVDIWRADGSPTAVAERIVRGIALLSRRGEARPAAEPESSEGVETSVDRGDIERRKVA